MKPVKTPTGHLIRFKDEAGRDVRLVVPGTKEDARVRHADEVVRISRIKAGLEIRAVNPSNLTLAQLAQRWLDESSARTASHGRTANAVKTHILGSKLAALRIEHVTRGAVESFLTSLRTSKGGKVVAPQTRNHVRSYLARMFVWAIEAELYRGTNPVAAVRRAKVQRKSLAVLTLDELTALVGAMRAPWSWIVATAALTALRKGELWGLDVADVDLTANTISVHRSHERDTTKTGRVRVVPIHPWLRPHLEAAIAFARSGPLFPGRGGTRRAQFSPTKFLKAGLKKAGITRHVRFHDLRHTCATVLLQAGAPIAHVSLIMGHASISMTADRYGHLLTQDLTDAMAKVTLPATIPPATYSAKRKKHPETTKRTSKESKK